MSQIIVPLIIILLLVAVNGLFVAAEFAIIGIRPSRIEQLVADGNRPAVWVHEVVSSTGKLDRYIATAQLGITLASLGLGMYAEPAIAHLIEEPLHNYLGLEGASIHTVSFIIALSLITYLHVVLGEMVPKSLALQTAERMVLLLSLPMRLMERVFTIPVVILNRFGVLLLRLFRVPPPSEQATVYSPEELELIVTESYVGGLLEEQEHDLFTNIFDFSDRLVVLVMTPYTVMESLDIDIEEHQLLETLAKSPHSRLPVYQGSHDNIIGMIHVKDVIRQQISEDGYDLNALLRKIPFVPETMPVDTLLASFKKQHIHMAVVIDEHGSIVGLVTLEDLIEEVFGELRDEFDTDETDPIVVEKPGVIVASGYVPIEDIEEFVLFGEHRHDVYTIGGLTIAELGKLPEVGEEVTIDDVRIRIEEVDGHAVKQVRIFYPQEAEKPSENQE